MVTKKLSHKKGKKKAVRRKKTRKWKVSPWLVAGGLLLVAAGVLYPVCGWIAQPKFLTAFSLIGVLAVIINSMRLNRMKI